MLILGEVHTGFLRNSIAVGPELSAQLLALAEGEQVRLRERPIRHAGSPEQLFGIDCRLAARSGSAPLGTGTVMTRASITGGQALQGSSFMTVVQGEPQRQPWSYYLARPGIVEARGRISPDDLADGFLAGSDRIDTVDLGSISESTMDRVQRSPLLDQRAPIRVAHTRLRWAALSGEDSMAGPGRSQFVLSSGGLRTLLLVGYEGTPSELAAGCEDIALHDWLLTCLRSIIDGADGVRDRDEAARRLRPALEHLVHLWMPAARVDEDLWKAVNRRAGMDRQWETSVDWVKTRTTNEHRSPAGTTRPEVPVRRKAFISYVREDAAVVDRIVDELRSAGIEVWIDRLALRVGDHWPRVIEEAIADHDFFIACFSSSYARKERSYMSAELATAAAELRLRHHDRRWFLPVRLDECETPNISIGFGQTLRDVQHLDFSDDWDLAMSQLVRVITDDQPQGPTNT